MSKIYFEQSRPSFSVLIGNGKSFEVPVYQRNYSWTYDEWDDLWNDIDELGSNDEHYLGYVVLKKTAQNKHFEIIDGQQRITTLSIIVLAAIDLLSEWAKSNIEPNENSRRIEILKTNYIGFEDGKTLVTISKLKLNRLNDYFYKSYLTQLRKPSNIANEKPSVKNLYKAFIFYKEKLSEKFESNPKGAELFSFIDNSIGSSLFFSLIEVDSDINAYKIFETLNARGTKLSVSDLLKNFLFSKILIDSPALIEDLELKWEAINNKLGKIDLTQYVRHYWNATNGKIERKNSLFKALKENIKNQHEALHLLNALEENVDVYVALRDENNEIWNEEQKKYIAELNLFEVQQCFVLLLVAKPKLASNEFTNLLRDIVNISFRYNVIAGQNPSILENIFIEVAYKIFKNDLTTSRDIFKILSKVYVSDFNFKNDFATKAINTSKSYHLAKYILNKLEKSYGGHEFSLNDSTITIEHVLPERPDDEWINNFGSEEYQNFIYRIGNLTLLTKKQNNLVARKSFQDKNLAYKECEFNITNSTFEYDVWNAKTLNERQNRLAQRATSIWKINY